MKNKGKNYYHKIYENVVVKFEKDCLGEICKDLGLESLINCSKRGVDGGVTCDCNELTNFAKAIEVGIINIEPNTACMHRGICNFSEGCAGETGDRRTRFDCNLEKLIRAELAKMEVKSEENKDKKLQFLLFR